MIRVYPQSFSVLYDSLIWLANIFVEYRQIIMRLKIIRIESEGFFVFPDGFVS